MTELRRGNIFKSWTFSWSATEAYLGPSQTFLMELLVKRAFSLFL